MLHHGHGGHGVAQTGVDGLFGCRGAVGNEILPDHVEVAVPGALGAAIVQRAERFDEGPALLGDFPAGFGVVDGLDLFGRGMVFEKEVGQVQVFGGWG